MIVLDTNVVSALMRDDPDRAVIVWLDGVPLTSVWTTAVTVLEVRSGFEYLRDIDRKRDLETAFDRVIEEIDGRVLPFDTPAAERAATFVAAKRRSGRDMDVRDAQIAGIVAARRARLATRNIRHFQELGLTLLDPWAG